MAKEFICTLAKEFECESRGYSRECNAMVYNSVARIACDHRVEATVIPGVEPKPEPVEVEEKAEEQVVPMPAEAPKIPLSLGPSACEELPF